VATVLVPVLLRKLTAEQSRIEIAAVSVGELLDRLEALHPGTRRYLLDEAGGVRSHVNIFVNQADIRDGAGLHSPVGPRDEVAIIPAMAGGAGAVGSTR
jgi:sulfur-carrier protein